MEISSFIRIWSPHNQIKEDGALDAVTEKESFGDAGGSL